jgi:hypothetical protein
MAATDGSLATLTFAGLVGDITGFSWSGMTRETIDTTALANTVMKSFISATLLDPGEISAEINVDANPTVPLTTYARTGGALVFTFKDSTGSVRTCTTNAICTSCDPVNVSAGEQITCSMTFKITGADATAVVPAWS